MEEDSLEIVQAFGAESNSKSSVCFISENKLMLLVGSNILKVDLGSNGLGSRPKIIPIKTNGKVEFFKVSPNLNDLILVDMDQRNTFMSTLNAKSAMCDVKHSIILKDELVNSVSIANNSELLACQTSNANILLYSFPRLNQLVKLKSSPSANEVSFFGTDSKRLLLTGVKFAKIYLYTKRGDLKLVYSLDCDLWLESHSWLTKTECVSWDKFGNLFLIEPKLNQIRTLIIQNGQSQMNDQVPRYLESALSFNNLNLSHSAITTNSLGSSTILNRRNQKASMSSLVKLNEDFQKRNNYLNSLPANSKSRIFSTLNLKVYSTPSYLSIQVLVCVNKGFFLVYSKDDRVFFYDQTKSDSHSYIQSSTIRLKSSPTSSPTREQTSEQIIAIHMNPSQTLLIALTSHKLLYSAQISTLFTTPGPHDISFALIFADPGQNTCHFASITGLDSCVRRPQIVASCSADRCLSIWNADSGKIEMQHFFDEELLGVAMHPSGLYLLLSTQTSLKLIGLSVNLIGFKVIGNLSVRACTSCVFGNSGAYFAFLHGTVVQIYSFINFVETGSIKTQDLGKIKQLKFSSNDQLLMCCSMAGIIRIWNSHTLTVMCEIMTKGLSYIGLALHPNQEWLFLISTEKTIRQFQLPNMKQSRLKVAKEAKLIRKLETRSEENLTCIEMSKSGKFVCIGTNKGFIRIYFLPNGNHKEFRAHFTSITRLCITHFDKYLITSCEDGSAIAYRIASYLRDDVLQVEPRSYLLHADPNDELLIDRNDYMKRIRQISFLEAKLKDSYLEQQFKLRTRELKFNVKKRELMMSYSAQMEEIKRAIEILIAQDEKAEVEVNSRFISAVEKQALEFENLKNVYREKLSVEEKRNDELRLKVLNFQNFIPDSNFDSKKSMDITTNLEAQLISNLKIMEAKIEDQINFEFDLEEEIRCEWIQLMNNIDRQTTINLEENKSQKDDLAKLRFECKLQRQQLTDYLVTNFEKNKTLSEIRSKLKEAVHDELELKKDLEQKDEQLEKEYMYLESLKKDSEKLENYCKIMREKNMKFEKNHLIPIRIENIYFSNEILQIREEVKLRTRELSRLKYENSLINSKAKARANKLDEQKTELSKCLN